MKLYQRYFADADHALIAAAARGRGAAHGQGDSAAEPPAPSRPSLFPYASGAPLEGPLTAVSPLGLGGAFRVVVGGVAYRVDAGTLQRLQERAAAEQDRELLENLPLW